MRKFVVSAVLGAVALSATTVPASSQDAVKAPRTVWPPLPVPEEPPAGTAPSPPRPQPARLTIERDLEYTRAGNRALHLDLYRRATPDNKALPVIVWIHGDAGLEAGKSPTPAARLIANGYAVASVEYRSSKEASPSAALHDIKAAVRWLRANAARYNLDGDHIGAWGVASGATLASLLGTTGDVPALEGDEGNPNQSSRVQAVAHFSGPVGGSAAGPAKAIDPTTYASKNDAPFLIVQGTADDVVPVRQSEMLQITLMRAGVDNDLELVVGASHSFAQVQTPAIADMVTNVFDRHLRDGRHQRDDVDAIGEPADSWVDAFSDDLPGTQSRLYATTSRGAGTQGSYRIYLPPHYDAPANARRRFPVIYFLHGFGDDSREALLSGYVARIDAAIRSGLMPPAIVVAVQSPNMSSFEDSADGRTPAESVFMKDLIPTIDRTYRTVTARDGRAIDGHSMGGTGALRLGFKYPDLFGSVSAISPAMTSRGSGGIVIEDLESPWGMVAKNADRIRGRINVQIIEGADDGGPRGGLRRVQWMSKVLDQFRIEHALIMSPGAKHPVKDELSRLDASPFTFYARAFARFK